MCGVYEHAAPDARTELSTVQWKGVIDSAATLGTMIVSFTGGEPVLRSDVFELIGYARQRGMAVHLCSNGTIISEEIALRLQQAGADTVSISVESASPQIHDRLRGEGSFDRAVQGIRTLVEHAPRVKVGINYLITAINYRGMTAMIPFAEELGVHQIKFAPIHTNLLHKNKPIEDYEDLLLKANDLEDLESEVASLVRAVRKTRLQTTSTAFLKGISALYSEPHRFPCYAGYAACAINPQGYVAPCCDITSTLNVKDQSLDEIWRSPQMSELRKKVFTCQSACWDTTNTELSLRLSLRSLFLDIPETWRDLHFYFGGDR